MFVRVVAFNTELSKYESWEEVNHVNKSINVLFETNSQFQQCKKQGVGQTTILKFLQLIQEGQRRGEIAVQGESYGNSSCDSREHEKPKTLSDIGISRKESTYILNCMLTQ